MLVVGGRRGLGCSKSVAESSECLTCLDSASQLCVFQQDSSCENTQLWVKSFLSVHVFWKIFWKNLSYQFTFLALLQNNAFIWYLGGLAELKWLCCSLLHKLSQIK